MGDMRSIKLHFEEEAKEFDIIYGAVEKLYVQKYLKRRNGKQVDSEVP